jgi:transglutaminase-like putative cysteine protease
MRLKIHHRTEYSYAAAVPHALQRVRLVPASGATQTVVSWSLRVEGAKEEVQYFDQFGNDTRLLSVAGAPHLIAFDAAGEIETKDTSGVTGEHHGFTPLWLYLRQTQLTTAGDAITGLAKKVGKGTEIERLHALMALISDDVAYQPGTTTVATAAEEALVLKVGVCQDHAHIFVTAARVLGFPARYVSGYLMLDDQVEQAASHAWAEAHVQGLGWVAFDVSNCISPDERYVRIAVGRDYRDAMPVSGFRVGQPVEQLAVVIRVEQ